MFRKKEHFLSQKFRKLELFKVNLSKFWKNISRILNTNLRNFLWPILCFMFDSQKHLQGTCECFKYFCSVFERFSNGNLGDCLDSSTSLLAGRSLRLPLMIPGLGQPKIFLEKSQLISKNRLALRNLRCSSVKKFT